MQFYPWFLWSIWGVEYADTTGLVIGQSWFIEVPQWFEPWYKIQERLSTKVFKKIDELLSNNDPEVAIHLYKRYTCGNKEHTWH